MIILNWTTRRLKQAIESRFQLYYIDCLQKQNNKYCIIIFQFYNHSSLIFKCEWIFYRKCNLPILFGGKVAKKFNFERRDYKSVDDKSRPWVVFQKCKKKRESWPLRVNTSILILQLYYSWSIKIRRFIPQTLNEWNMWYENFNFRKGSSKKFLLPHKIPIS